jgi:hypothetical protein
VAGEQRAWERAEKERAEKEKERVEKELRIENMQERMAARDLHHELKAKNTEVLRLRGSLSLRSAFGECETRGWQRCLRFRWAWHRCAARRWMEECAMLCAPPPPPQQKKKPRPSLYASSARHTHTRARSPEACQDEVVRPTLGLVPKAPITAGVWNAFLEQRPDVRARVECQTRWRKEKVGTGIAHIYTTLCGHIHGFQIGDETVAISHQLLPPDECLAAAAVLDETFLCEFDPPAIKDKYDFNADQAAKGRG